MSEINLIVDTNKHVWTMVWGSMMALYLFPSFCQYQFMYDLIIHRYPAFTISFPAFMTCLLNVFLSCNEYDYDDNLI